MVRSAAARRPGPRALARGPAGGPLRRCKVSTGIRILHVASIWPAIIFLLLPEQLGWQAPRTRLAARRGRARKRAPAGLDLDDARVVYAGRQLAPDALLSSCGAEDGAALDVLGRLLGGGKKRKKKTYTKPKKGKHKHKNVKLRVLKFYKVEESGKVTRTRKQCPNETCGAGIFMATHTDRVSCGRCGTTYKYGGTEA